MHIEPHGSGTAATTFGKNRRPPGQGPLMHPHTALTPGHCPMDLTGFLMIATTGRGGTRCEILRRFSAGFRAVFFLRSFCHSSRSF
jgi:hypothetical protein